MIRKVFTRFYCAAANRTNITNVLQADHPNIDVEDISFALKKLPQLSNINPTQWQTTFDFLINKQAFPQDSCIKIVADYPAIFHTSLDTTFKHLEAWRALQFGERRLQDLIIKHPLLIPHGNERLLTQRLAFIQGFVTSTKNVWRIMMSSPEVTIQPEQILEKKFKYLIEKMRIEIPEIVDSNVFSYDLEFIKIRHVFMERLGLYKVKSLKKDAKNDKNTNPRLSKIVDSPNKRFATKLCYVTLEEYEVFQELLKREWERKDVNDEDDNFDEMQKDQGIDVII